MREKLQQVPYYGLLLLLTYMPFHIFLSQSLSLLTGGLSVWKVAKDVFTLALAAFVIIAVWLLKKRTKTFDQLAIITIVYGLFCLGIWALNPHIDANTALLGMVYDNRLLWYLLIGLGAGLLLHKKINQNFLIKLVIILSTIVCVLGIIQYFLPPNFLTHFGYSLARGARPSFQIDSRVVTRIMSTIRDPNSLGAYLILPITLLCHYIFSGSQKRRTQAIILLALHVTALILTFSRSAWLGAVLSVVVLAWIRWHEGLWRFAKKYWPALIIAILILAAGAFSLRHNFIVQNVLEHSSQKTTQPGSDTLHVRRVDNGIKKIIKKPLGYGPGTAGIVSIRNPNGGFLPEDYYIQIGYEIGILGLALFIFINVYVYLKLYKQMTPLGLCLVSSFWAYVLVNLVLQIWSNEAVAAQWWLLAGVMLAVPTVKDKKLTAAK